MAGDTEKAGGTGETNRLRSTFRALRHRNFQLFFSGQFVSLIGTWMQIVAQSWLVYRLTGSVVLLGLIGFAGQFPVFLLAPFGGATADRYNRHKILIFTQSCAMIFAFILATLTLTGNIQVWHLFVIAALFGTANAFDIPARQAFAVDMVGREDLINAIALNSSMFNGARIVGPAIAGILVAAVGEGWCFLSNAVSYIAVLTGLLLMKIKPEVRPRTGSTLSNIVEGFTFVAKTKPIRALLLLLGLISLVGMPYAVLMPIFADKILGGGSASLGLLMGASGIGALIAALSLATRSKVFGLGRWVAFASTGLGISLILFFFAHLLAVGPAAGTCRILDDDPDVVLEHAGTGDGSRCPQGPRNVGLFDDVYGDGPLRALLAGTLAGYLGAPYTVMIGGSVCIAGSLIFALKLPKLRAEGQQMIVSMQMTGGEPASKASFQQPPMSAAEANKK